MMMQENNIKILIADGDDSLRNALSAMLLEENFIVESSDNGQEALHKAKNEFFNIAVLDYHLPDIDGIRLGKNIKQIAYDTEVILLSSETSFESAIQAIKENIYDYLPKPVSHDKLLEAINGALKKQHLVLENKKLLWELRMSNKKLEKLNKFKDGLISMISHDLRSPISSLKGFNYSLLEGYAGELNKDQKEIINTENEAIDSMMDLINNLLDMRQIEAGQLQMKKSKADIFRDVVEPVSKRLSPQLKSAKIAISIDCEEGLPEVYIDVSRISQVVQNLVQNAIKFTPENGNVDIRVLNTESDQIELRVTDTGRGIPQESLNTIFEVFYTQDERKRARDKTGRGLGLSICKNIIKAHRGLIWAESDGRGSGSTFIVILPVYKSEKKTVKKADRN